MNNKTEQLKQEIINNEINYQYLYLIMKYINNGSLNNLINNISNTKTKLKITSITKKNYLTANEQFLALVNNFIYHFKEQFYFLNNNCDYIIELLLQNEKYTDYLLCKKYIGDNENIDFFTFNIKRLIVHGFYINLKKLSKKSEIIKKLAKDNNINLKQNLINNKKEINKLYELLIKISICNAKELNNILLFENIKQYTNKILENNNNTNIKKSILNHYITNWENMIKNYYQKKEIIKLL